MEDSRGRLTSSKYVQPNNNGKHQKHMAQNS